MVNEGVFRNWGDGRREGGACEGWAVKLRYERTWAARDWLGWRSRGWSPAPKMPRDQVDIPNWSGTKGKAPGFETWSCKDHPEVSWGEGWWPLSCLKRKLLQGDRQLNLSWSLYHK
jgi:hypothetical protein